MQIDSTLKQAYVETFFYIDQIIGFSSFCVITACNPRSIILSDEENLRRNSQLESLLQLNKTLHLLAGDINLEWSEASYAVEISLQNGLDLAKAFDQNAIYYVESGELYLAFVTGEIEKIGKFESKVKPMP